MFTFAEEMSLIEKAPKLERVKNEARPRAGSQEKHLYTLDSLQSLLNEANLQMKTMIMLALNCGFGPKDIQDLTWKHIDGERVTLPRSKTGVCQRYLLWLETLQLLNGIKQQRSRRISTITDLKSIHDDNGCVFVTRFRKSWNRDAIAEQFRKLCKKAGVPCYGFYRLRHCASTAMSLVATPHVHRKFMRHSQLQQQVTYTHTPDTEVDLAIMRAKEKLLGKGSSISGEERNRGQEEVV